MSDEQNRDPLAAAISAMRPQRTDGRGGDDYLVPREDADADALLARIVATPVTRRRWPWRRTTFVVVGITTLVGAGVTAAVLVTRSPDDPFVISCASSFADNADSVLVVPAADAPYEASCAPLWSDGTLSTAGSPPLAACVRAEGTVLVAPGAYSVCAELGMQLADADDPTNDRLTQLYSALSERFAGRCLEPDEAVAEAEAVVTDLELTNWSVDPSGTRTGLCNGPFPDADVQAIVFSPFEPVTE